ncbi:hypothetical protein BJ878DRAFT_541754 [Calycina marina]|uniref:Uncharacterized protein n=1 Tax=Calycina marina TaxID=1763456 RepID=A0A9P7Z456_9HELO|nr:hypothetical protein BJ878DRAFT_541754 [Calycina marina]
MGLPVFVAKEDRDLAEDSSLASKSIETAASDEEQDFMNSSNISPGNSAILELMREFDRPRSEVNALEDIETGDTNTGRPGQRQHSAPTVGPAYIMNSFDEAEYARSSVFNDVIPANYSGTDFMFPNRLVELDFANSMSGNVTASLTPISYSLSTEEPDHEVGEDAELESTDNELEEEVSDEDAARADDDGMENAAEDESEDETGEEEQDVSIINRPSNLTINTGHDQEFEHYEVEEPTEAQLADGGFLANLPFRNEYMLRHSDLNLEALESLISTSECGLAAMRIRFFLGSPEHIAFASEARYDMDIKLLEQIDELEKSVENMKKRLEWSSFDSTGRWIWTNWTLDPDYVYQLSPTVEARLDVELPFH